MANSHYVPMLTLRKFAAKLCLFNVQTGEYKENIKIDKTFSEQGFYSDEVEEKLNKRIDNTQNKVNRVSNDVLVNTSDISDNREGLTETFEATLTNTDDVAINRQAIEELFELITAESEVK